MTFPFPLPSWFRKLPNVNPESTCRLNHALRDTQNVCALTKVGTVLKNDNLALSECKNVRGVKFEFGAWIVSPYSARPKRSQYKDATLVAQKTRISWLLSDPLSIKDDSSMDAISSLSDTVTVKTTRIMSKSFTTTTGNNVRNKGLHFAARLVTSAKANDDQNSTPVP